MTRKFINITRYIHGFSTIIRGVVVLIYKSKDIYSFSIWQHEWFHPQMKGINPEKWYQEVNKNMQAWILKFSLVMNDLIPGKLKSLNCLLCLRIAYTANWAQFGWILARLVLLFIREITYGHCNYNFYFINFHGFMPFPFYTVCIWIWMAKKVLTLTGGLKIHRNLKLNWFFSSYEGFLRARNNRRRPSQPFLKNWLNATF